MNSKWHCKEIKSIVVAIRPVLDINFIRLFIWLYTRDPVFRRVDAVMESVFTSCFPVHGEDRYQNYRKA